MNDERKTNAQLIEELRLLRAKLKRLDKTVTKLKLSELSASRREQASRESEEDFRSIIDNHDDAVLLTLPDGRILSANPAASRMFGRSESEIRELGRNGVVDLADRRLPIAINERESSGRFRGEFTLIRRDGQKFPAEVTSTVFKSLDGGLRTSIIIRDVTERKRAEEALRESEERFREQFQSIPIPTYIWENRGDDFVLLEYNRASEELTQGEIAKLRGTNAKKLYEDSPSIPRHLSQCVVQKKTLKEQIRYRLRSTNEPKDFALTYVYLPPAYVMVHTEDITDRKRTEESLALLAHAIRSIGESVSITDAENKILFVNDAFLRTYGYTADELINKSITVVRSSTAEPPADTVLGATVQGGWHGELVNRKRDGTEFPISLSTSVVRNEKGQPIALVGIAADITERERAQEALKKTTQLLRDTGEMAKVGGWELDLSTKEVLMSEEVCRIHGVEPGYKPKLEEAIKFYAPESIPSLEATLKKTIETGEPYDLESLFTPSGGEDKIWVRSLGRAVYSGGKIVRLAGTFQNIDKYKKAEEALRLEKENFRHSLDESPLGVRIVTADGDTLYANRAILDFYGYDSLEELQRTPLRARYTPESYAEFQKRKQQRQRGDFSTSEYEISIVRINCEVLHLQVHRKVVLWNNAQRFLVMYQDITERKRAEETLRESEDRYRDLVANSSDLICTHDLDGNLLSVNNAALKISGYSEEEALKMNMQDIIVPEYRRLFKAYVAKIKAIGKTKGLVIVQTKTGERRIWEYNNTLRTQGVAKPIVRGMVKDITERKRAEEALAESERKLRTLFEVLPVGVSILNAQRKIVYLNPALERILDISKESLLKGDYGSRTYLRPDGKLMPAEEFASVRAIKEQRAVHDVETGVVKEDGIVIWTTVSTVPLGSPDWEVLVVTSDITERKRAAEALRASEERYRRLFEGDLAGDYVSTPAGKLIACNAAFARIFRFKSIDDALATDTHELYPNPEARQLFLRSLRQNRRLELREAWMKRRDGTDLHVIENSFGVFDDKGELIEIRGYLLDDTERKQAEISLRQSMDQIDLLLKVSSYILYRCEAFGDFDATYISSNIESILGYKPDDFLQKGFWASNIHPEDAPRIFAEIPQLFERGWKKHEYRFKDKNGSWRWMYDELRLNRDEQGNPVDVLGSMVDITERKRAEEELQRSEMQYRSLTDNSPDLIARFDRQYRHLYVNPTAAKAGRYSPDEYVGKTMAEVGVPEEEASKWEGRIRTAFETGQVVDVEDSFETPQGSRNFHTKFVPEFAPDGSIHSVQSIARDITERKRAEEALRESEETMRYIIKHDPNAIAVYDLNLHYIAASDRYLRDYNVKKEDVIGKHHYEVFPEMPEKWKEVHRRCLTGAIERNDDDFFERPDGSITYNRWECRPWYRVDGTIGGMITYTEVTTERKMAEQELRTSTARLRQLANHLQTVREEERKHIAQEFHDELGQTLTALKMDLALLQRELADKTREVSRSTLGAKTQSMQGLIDAGIQAIRETMSELHPALLDQLGLVAALEWEAERFQKRSGLKCRFTSELGELPFSPKTSIALFRIFQEAVTNVARHAQATLVEISVQQESDDVILEIKDNGIGIEPNAEHKERSFGLVGMRERAILLGGTMEITGIKGRGTTIVVRMPYEQTLPDGGVAPW